LEKALTTIASLDPVFAQMGAASAGHAGSVPELTDREKVFLYLTADVCQQTLGMPFELHVQRALDHGVSTADIRALLRLISYDTGYHAALAAFERLVEIEAAAGIPAPETEPLAENLLATGPDAAESPLPQAVAARLAELDDHFSEYMALQSRMRLPAGPGTLDVRERSFTTMSIDIHYQTLGDTFQIHVTRALRGGATPDDVRAVLRFTAQFGVTRAWHAWQPLNKYIAGFGG
jgi:alkylhydroperoxidase/carboxymuconolactone decarboxylase family protein YurZ